MSNTTSTAKGLEGVVAASTRLSDVRGDVGELIYCGYNIDELAGKVSYEEVVHLLYHNRLPNAKELAELKREVHGQQTNMPLPCLYVKCWRSCSNMFAESDHLHQLLFDALMN